MQIDFFEHFKLGASAQIPPAELVKFAAGNAIRGLAFRVQVMRFGRAFMVHSQNSASRVLVRILAGGVNVINVHAVMLVTNAGGPVIGLCALVGIGCNAAVEWITTGMQDFEAVAGRQNNAVKHALIDRTETQGSALGPTRSTDASATRQHGHG